MEKTILQPRFKDSQHFKDFWTKGNGKQLLDFSGAEVSFKVFEKFSSYFYDVDEVGDQVVKDSEGLVARLEECADQGIRCGGGRLVHCSLSSTVNRWQLQRPNPTHRRR